MHGTTDTDTLDVLGCSGLLDLPLIDILTVYPI